MSPLTSQLDLSRKETFRDLSKPMGAQSEERRSTPFTVSCLEMWLTPRHLRGVPGSIFTAARASRRNTAVPVRPSPCQASPARVLTTSRKQLWNTLLERHDRRVLSRSITAVYYDLPRLVSSWLPSMFPTALSLADHSNALAGKGAVSTTPTACSGLYQTLGFRAPSS